MRKAHIIKCKEFKKKYNNEGCKLGFRWQVDVNSPGIYAKGIGTYENDPALAKQYAIG